MNLSDILKRKVRSCAMWAVLLAAIGVWSLHRALEAGWWLDVVTVPVAFMTAGVWLMLGIDTQNMLNSVRNVEQVISDFKKEVDKLKNDDK